MSDTQDKQPSKADAELEREIRKGRKFTLSEAIGRLAGPGMMKGVSPVDRKHQAEVEIQDYLKRHLNDGPGALQVVLLRRVIASEPFLKHYNQPLLVLAICLKRALDSDYLLKELVRDADIEWGQLTGERPFFEREGQAPHPDDPYTNDSVRTTLTQLVEELSVEVTGTL